MEIIIAIVIVAIGVAVWFNRKAPAKPVVEEETYSDNGIKFAVKEEAPAPVVEEVPAKKTRAPRATKPRAPKVAKAPKAPAKKVARSKKA
jgi:hypothetical protein